MSAIVYQITGWADGTDTGARLGNCTLARPIVLPAAWTKIRVGMRLQCVHNGGNVTGTPRFAVGFGSGTSNMVGDATTKNWIGAITNEPVWTINSPSGYSWYTIANTNPMVAAARVGSAWTIGAAVSPIPIGLAARADGSNDGRQLLFVDVATGSPNYTVSAFAYNANSYAGGSSYATFMNLMPSTAPVLSGYTYTSGAVAFSQVAGTLDTVQIMWPIPDTVSQYSGFLDIYDLAVAVLA